MARSRTPSRRVVSALSLFLSVAACASPATRSSDGGAGARQQSTESTELIAPTSFDECYPPRTIGKRKTEPPLFMLANQRAPFEILTISSREITLADPASGWRAPFDDARFGDLWEQSKQARRLHPTGTDLTLGDPEVFLLAIDCGDSFSWHIRITAKAAAPADDVTKQIAQRMFDLLQNRPADAHN